MNGRAGTMRKVAVAATCVVGLAGATSGSAGTIKSSPIVVSDAAGLQNALAGAEVGQRILMRPGTYRVGSTLAVPDGVTLQGSGVMQGETLPTGFEAGSETRIVALPELQGDVVTLGDGATLRALSVEDATGRFGNVVSAGSHVPNDSVTVSIVECEIVNPNKAAGDANGPAGGGIVVITRNLGGAAAPAPDTGSAVTLWMRRSIARSTSGGPAMFAVNSASDGRLDIHLAENVFRGRLDVLGGVSRGDEVTGASITIDSARNLYAPIVPFPNAWSIVGGSAAPVIPSGPGASSNQVYLDSRDDRIEGTTVGISAMGGRRFGTEFGPNSDNRVELSVSGLTLGTIEAGGADFFFAAGLSFGEFAPGDGNVISVRIRETTGSGARANVYAHVRGPELPENGGGNRLEFVGTAAAFQESNTNIDPAPRADFFAG